MKLHHLFLTLLFCALIQKWQLVSNEIAFLNNDNKWKINTANQIASGKSLRIRLYLEGAMLNAPNVFGSDGKRLMRDDLRVSPFTGINYIPLTDPYQKTIKFVNLAVKHKHVGVGSLPQYSTITDSASVFGVTGENAIVDWVFVEIRSARPLFSILEVQWAEGSIIQDCAGKLISMDMQCFGQEILMPIQPLNLIHLRTIIIF